MSLVAVTTQQSWPLFSRASTQALEGQALHTLGPHTLMARAGLAAARLCLALAPHARTVWVACGPGNNGGDGAVAARHLHQWGKTVVLTRVVSANTPADAQWAWQQAQAAGLSVAEQAPSHYDIGIDALLGLGQARPFDSGAGSTGSSAASAGGTLAQHAAQLNRGPAPVLALDLPSGLGADSGLCAPGAVRARWTLALLTLKPGLFMTHGRDLSGELWFDDLGVDSSVATVNAQLTGQHHAPQRAHASHKGSYGELAVLGGARGMAGAAQLAASAALHAGAGRVYLCCLDSQAPSLIAEQAELMVRQASELALDTMTVVAGCGGGEAIRAVLPRAITQAAQLVLDADALNALAQDPALAQLLQQRGQRSDRGRAVLTPHPLEAARLLGSSVGAVLADRLGAAQTLSQRFQAVVVLKGAGTVCAAPGQTPTINPTGNARLASAGTGDVLAGWIGAALAQGLPPFAAATRSVYAHGQMADQWPSTSPLSASALARAARL